MKEKLTDLLDIIKWRTEDFIHEIERFFVDLKRWFSYFKIMRKVYDFDYSGILEVERHQIKRTRDDIIKYHHHTYWWRDVRNMNLALSLIAIILEEDEAHEHIGGDLIIGEPDEHGSCRVTCDSQYRATKYVNTRNGKRFSMEEKLFENSEIGPLFKSYLRVEKAWNLYHKLRTNTMRSWWD